MLRVPRCKGGMTSKDNPRNHGVSQFHRASFFVPGRHQFAGVLGGNGSEESNSSLHFVNQNRFERLYQTGAPLSRWQNLQSEFGGGR